MEERKNLEKRKEALRQKMLQMVDNSSEKKIVHVKLQGYMRELRIDYSKDEFDFLPGEFMLNNNECLSICLGVGRSPNMASYQVLWFLSEGSNEINFVDNYHLPSELKERFVAVPC
jgi:hypothetical protein